MEVTLTEAGTRALGIILGSWPPISQDLRRRKILDVALLLAQVRGKESADKELIIEAARLALPKLYDVLVYKVEDPAKLKRLRLDPYFEIGAYKALPRQVKRWSPTPHKPLSSKTVLAFNSSPRKGGNTDVLLDAAIEGAKDASAIVKKIQLGSLDIKSCLGCWKCKEKSHNGYCAVKDDMDDLYPELVRADAFIIGFPIFLAAPCARLLAFLERWNGLLRFPHESVVKPGALGLVIGTWGDPHVDTYDYVIAHVIATLYQYNVETVEAISACGLDGLWHGLDEDGKAIITHYPLEIERAYLAGKHLILGG